MSDASADIGSGTAAMLVLRSVGGAGGSSIAGAVLAQDLAGSVHPPASFDLIFMIAAGFAALTFVATLLMPDVKLRRAQQPAPIGE